MPNTSLDTRKALNKKKKKQKKKRLPQINIQQLNKKKN